ncbi:DUF6415 family natural product biosynthesis protein [Streptomyces sp. NPDC060209]|uniref:DUF6415 family natural product biosynthesis protein n=1 Tax=Streptomyces sp. NPDC060209 TaxID=3347073 RepID=UPI003651E082
MRHAAEQTCDVARTAGKDLQGAIAKLRAYTEVLVPEVKYLATRAPADDQMAMVALIGVEEGLRRLSSHTSSGDPRRVARRPPCRFSPCAPTTRTWPGRRCTDRRPGQSSLPPTPFRQSAGGGNSARQSKFRRGNLAAHAERKRTGRAEP